MAIDINTVIENLNELLTNSVNLTDKYYDLFINPEPMMVDLELFNEDNELVVVTVPNRAQDREAFGAIIDKVDGLARVAETGDWNDLINKPEIPSADSFANKDLSNLTSTGLSKVLPSQTGNTGKFLTTNGSTASWVEISLSDDEKYHALKGYEDAGELLTDTEGLVDVTSYAHSTFDSAKFTVAGSATVTADGIASGISVNSSSNINLSSAPTTWTIVSPIYKITTASTSVLIPFSWGNASTGAINFSLRPNGVIGMNYNYTNGTGVAQASGTDIVHINTAIQCKWEYDNGTLTMSYKIGNDNWVVLETTTVTPCTSSGVIEFSRVDTNGCTCDLKTGGVKVDGEPVFSGNQTGVDTYTINGLTVVIPYTLSKTGSKIVDSAYRDRVSSMYEQLGYAPYYTLSDTDFTLPQGELYGYIKKEIQNTSSIATVSKAGMVKPDGSTITVEDDGTISSTVLIRNIGEIIQSTIPLTDAGLHLLDGALIDGNGIYSAFVDYIADLHNSGSAQALFATESNWQSIVTTYGVCGKFVYDSTNNTVRLPKITGFVEGASGVTNLGDLTQAGLPDHTHSYSTVNNGYRATGGDLFYYNATGTYQTGAASETNPIYGRSNTVQPQSIKVLYYIVIATSTKTNIHVDIDEIATDLNGKADVDLTNVNNTGYTKMAGASMPSTKTIFLTVGASGTTYTAPANGWVTATFTVTDANGWGLVTANNVRQHCFWPTTGGGTQAHIPVNKGSIFRLDYGQVRCDSIAFTYAKGSESEAN